MSPLCSCCSKTQTVNGSKNILQEALNRASEQKLPLILASTTGRVAGEVLSMMKGTPLRLIVVGHASRRLEASERFSPQILQRLTAAGGVFLEDKAPWLPSLKMTRWLDRVFGLSALNGRERALEKQHGIGGKVCFLIAERAVKAGLIREGETVVTLGGHRAGVDTALLLRIGRGNPPEITLLERIEAV